MQIHHKHFVRILLFFYLFSSFVSATHIHHDVESSQDDCNVCIVVKNLHSGDISLWVPSDNAVSTYSIIIPLLAQQKRYYHLKHIHSQAPPLFT